MSILSSYRPEVRRVLPVLVAQRWLTNVGVRMMFTFLPAMARGTGLSIQEMGRVLTLRDLTGLAAPGVGRIADRKGTGVVMAATGMMAAVGLVLSIFSTAGLIIGFVVMGLGKIGFDVALNAWIGDEVEYEQRARAFGILELSWAGAALIGLPACGLLIDSIAWWAAPLVVGLLSILVSIRVYQMLDGVSEAKDDQQPRSKLHWRTLLSLASLSTLVLASQLLLVTHGLWLDDVHGLNPASIGSVVIIFGLIEMVATLATTAVTDRLGKRRSVLGGAVLLLVATTALVMVSDPPLAVGLAMLALAFLGFEFSFVSSLPLVAEIDPAARAQVMGVSLGMSTITRAAGSTIGTALYASGGFSRVMTLSAATTAVGLIAVAIFLHEPGEDRFDQNVIPIDPSDMLK